jgi:primosomal protein N'
LRWQILVKCAENDALPGILEIGKAFAPKPGVRLVIDVDPTDIL